MSVRVHVHAYPNDGCCDTVGTDVGSFLAPVWNRHIFGSAPETNTEDPDPAFVLLTSYDATAIVFIDDT